LIQTSHRAYALDNERADAGPVKVIEADVSIVVWIRQFVFPRWGA